MNKNKHWFALYTKPRSEFRAAEQLQRSGMQFYLPVVNKIKQWSDRKKKIREPLLRGYIFIFADEAERLMALEQQAVVRCIFDNGKPAVIPDCQIENLKKFLEYNTEFFVKDGIVPGKQVIIKSGPFKGITGTIKEFNNKRTLVISINLLKRSVMAHLPDSSIVEVL